MKHPKWKHLEEYIMPCGIQMSHGLSNNSPRLPLAGHVAALERGGAEWGGREQGRASWGAAGRTAPSRGT